MITAENRVEVVEKLVLLRTPWAIPKTSPPWRRELLDSEVPKLSDLWFPKTTRFWKVQVHM